jgi:hypothetical protein
MHVVIRDPWGHDHRLEHDGERWWGCENLAHGAAGGGREAAIGKVVHAVAGGHPLPPGYRKVIRVSGQPPGGETTIDPLRAALAIER